jgi:hypothetical protein
LRFIEDSLQSRVGIKVQINSIGHIPYPHQTVVHEERKKEKREKLEENQVKIKVTLIRIGNTFTNVAI